MPYNSVSDAESRNPALKKYSEKAKRGWFKSFNSVFDKDGDEKKAFAVAYSVANKIDGKKKKSHLVACELIRISRLLIAEKEATEEDMIAFFKDNPNPSDDKLHEWAEENDFDKHQVEEVVYKMTTRFVGLLTGGRSNEQKFTEKDADADELKMGIEVELEHSGDKELAKKIALDHLAEAKDYYTALDKMEEELDVKK